MKNITISEYLEDIANVCSSIIRSTCDSILEKLEKGEPLDEDEFIFICEILNRKVK